MREEVHNQEQELDSNQKWVAVKYNMLKKKKKIHKNKHKKM